MGFVAPGGGGEIPNEWRAKKNPKAKLGERSEQTFKKTSYLFIYLFTYL
jgi:hypothetical protein